MAARFSDDGVNQGYDVLTDKEKQTLRLLLEGHDAKSVARQLGLSVHTINERLRDARRKLAVSSSREAARVLREVEGAAPQLSGDKPFGDDQRQAAAQATATKPARSPLWRIGLIAGGFAMIFALALAAMSLSGSHQAAPSQTAATATTPATKAALDWLALVDAGDWQASYDAVGTSFRSANTFEGWRTASVEGRVPLGAVISRRAVVEIEMPTPPNGNMVVRFDTSFAKKPNTIETLVLVRESASWRVVGYWIG